MKNKIIYGIENFKVEKYIFISENGSKVSTSIWLKDSSSEPVNLDNKQVIDERDFFESKNQAIKRLIEIHRNQCVLLNYEMKKSL
jgi:hypothetical protein